MPRLRAAAHPGGGRPRARPRAPGRSCLARALRGRVPRARTRDSASPGGLRARHPRARGEHARATLASRATRRLRVSSKGDQTTIARCDRPTSCSQPERPIEPVRRAWADRPLGGGEPRDSVERRSPGAERDDPARPPSEDAPPTLATLTERRRARGTRARPT